MGDRDESSTWSQAECGGRCGGGKIHTGQGLGTRPPGTQQTLPFIKQSHTPGTLLFMVTPRDRLSAPFAQGRSSYEHLGVLYLGPRGHYFILYHTVLYILSFCFCLSALQRRSRQSKNNTKPQHLSKLETPITRGRGEGPEDGALAVPLGGRWPQLISGDALSTMAML